MHVQLKSQFGYESWIAPLLIAIISGFIASKPVLSPASRSPSATAASVVKEHFGPTELVLARAWEDPLLAVSEELGDSKPDLAKTVQARKGEISLATLDRLKPEKAAPPAASLLVVLQVLPGGPGLEDEESRRQFRLASTLAMQRCGYEPQTPGLIRLTVQAPVRGGLGRFIAAQWFARSATSKALLVFVPDVLLDQGRGLARVTDIGGIVQEQSGFAANDTTFIVLRLSSGELIEDLAECAVTPAPLHQKWKVVNAGSTVPLEDVFGAAGERVQLAGANAREALTSAQRHMLARENRASQGGSATMLASLNGWEIGRVMGSDQLLSDLLFRELELRRRGPSLAGNAVAVLCESDSTYGRKFAEQIRQTQVGDRVALFHFQSGLDIAPRSQQGREAYLKHRAEAEQMSRSGVTSPTAPLGPRGVDYVYRQLAAWENELGQQGNDLSAVILFAYDHYDKRPLVQLVRSRFPDALILTADMHALMTDPADFETMRNVVVATHLGLRAGKVAQDGLPPFRSCYQTATFLGLIQVIPSRGSADVELDKARAAMGASAPGGSVYEIGREGGVPVSGPEGAADWAYYPSFQVDTYKISTGALAVMFGMLLIAMAWCTRRSRRPYGAWTLYVPVVLMMGMMCFVYPMRAGLSSVSPDLMVITTFSILLLAVIYFQQLREPSFRRTLLALSPVAIVVFAYLSISADTATRVAGGIIGGIGLVVFLCLALTLDRNGRIAGKASAHEDMSRLTTQMIRICIISGALIFVFMLIRGGGPQLGEPWGWLDGVSAWPSEMIRILALTVACIFIVRCAHCVGRSLYEEVACMPAVPLRLGSRTGSSDAHSSMGEKSAGVHMEHRASPWSQRLRAVPGWFVGKYTDARTAIENSIIATWGCPYNTHGRVEVGELLSMLRQRTQTPAVTIRLALLSLVVSTIVVGCLISLDVPHAPIRGRGAFLVHAGVMIALGVALNFLVLQVLDAGNLCNRFVGLLNAGHSRWPDERRAMAASESGLPLEQIDSLLDITAVARATARVNAMVYYPMIVIVISAAAWHSRIDAWPMSSVLVVLYGLSAVACVAVGWAMRRGAERLRASEIQRLRYELNRLDSLDESLARDVADARKPCVELEIKFGRKWYVESITTPETQADRTDVLAIGNQTALAIAQTITVVTGEAKPGDPAQIPEPSDFSLRFRRTDQATLVYSDGRQVEPPQAQLIAASLRTASTTADRVKRMETTKARHRTRIESMIAQIQSISQGSFGPWSADPVMRAVVFPLVGILSVRFAEWVGLVFRGT